jgi:hypothetical protein
MNDEQKKQVAIFRFGVISDFVSPTRLGWGERARLVRQKCDRQWQIPFSQRTHLSPATIRSWIRAYEKSGQQIESLYLSAQPKRSRSSAGFGSRDHPGLDRPAQRNAARHRQRPHPHRSTTRCG